MASRRSRRSFTSAQPARTRTGQVRGAARFRKSSIFSETYGLDFEYDPSVETRSLAPFFGALAMLAAPLAAGAATLSGVCPDGSFFVVQSRDAVPCSQPHFVDDPSELPPLRPHLLPRPYTWYVDQEARNPNNPA